jgi:predicted AlkP superfamily phosphohydrolase/phosphomutase
VDWTRDTCILTGGTVKNRLGLILLFTLIAILIAPEAGYAYIGPGAGFAFMTSFLILFATFFLAFFFFLTWPIRFLIKRIRRRGKAVEGRVEKVIILGFDGLDPGLLQQYLKKGIMPNIQKLMDAGSFKAMRSTTPPISPVAWSSFSTGVNPGKHNIFDFLAPERRSYLSKLSSAEIRPPTKFIRLGKYKFPLGKPSYRPLRKSKPFWTILGENEVFSSIIRVPITFPPEKFSTGVLISSLCVPDLRGTQGSFSYFSSDPAHLGKHTGGFAYRLERNGNGFSGDIIGPPNAMLEGEPPLKIGFRLEAGANGDGGGDAGRGAPGGKAAKLTMGKQSVDLELGKHSPWVTLDFSAGLGIHVQGVARFILQAIEPEAELYMTPIHIDPEKPAMPISHPFHYSVYLSKLIGPYATMGLAEDTWALNERVIDEDQFIEQAYLINREREEMLMNELDKVKKGAVVCVFDNTDRLQHMLWRYIDPDHPANRDKESEKHKNALEDLYADVDRIVGKVMPYVDDSTALIVMSDHGFKSFRRGINLNAWLKHEGYLFMKEGQRAGEWFEGVDWSRTRAYALGLGGMFLNLKGRERDGIVSRDDAPALAAEIKAKLEGLKDPENGQVAIKNVYVGREVYSGPYTAEGPELIMGSSAGYRASWDAATGIVTDEVFSDNTKAWSGDHCVDPTVVPATFISNRKITADSVSIIDIAPTVLDLFGIKPPAYVDGKVVLE